MQFGSRIRTLGHRGAVALALALALMAAPWAATAQTAQQLEMVQEIEQLQTRINQVQAQAVEQTPSLVDSARAIEETMITKMEAAGHRPQDDLSTLERAEERLQDPSLNDEQRQAIVSGDDVAAAQRNLQAAMAAINGDAELAAMQERFEDDLLAAMKRVDPDIEQAYERGMQLQQALINSMQ